MDLDLDSERAFPGPPPGREELEEEVDEDEVGEVTDEEGEWEEELALARATAAFFAVAAFFRLVVDDAAGAGCESVLPGGMETPTAFLPAAARWLFLLFFLVIVGPGAVVRRSALVPFNESAAIPSAIAIAFESWSDDDDVRGLVVLSRSDDGPEPPLPAVVAVVAPAAGVGVASIRGTST